MLYIIIFILHYIIIFILFFLCVFFSFSEGFGSFSSNLDVLEDNDESTCIRFTTPPDHIDLPISYQPWTNLTVTLTGTSGQELDCSTSGLKLLSEECSATVPFGLTCPDTPRHFVSCVHTGSPSLNKCNFGCVCNGVHCPSLRLRVLPSCADVFHEIGICEAEYV